jgi:hypothetical protein
MCQRAAQKDRISMVTIPPFELLVELLERSGKRDKIKTKGRVNN